MEIEGIGSNGILLSQKCKFIAGGVELSGIVAMDIALRPGELVTAQLIIYVDRIELTGVGAKYLCIHPATGEHEEVEEIIFKSGEVWCAS
jgi:hypothetical protein